MSEDLVNETIRIFREALSLIDQDRIKDALEACSKMRLDHNLFGLGKASRAIANLLIIMLSVPGGYDYTQFAECSIRLIEDCDIQSQMEEQATKILVEHLHEKFAKK